MPEGLGETVHASCVVVGERGLLIRGPSGAGKSTLTRQILAAARHEGRFARLVSDDRTRVGEQHGRLVARAVAPIAGRLEVRGIGLVAAPFEAAAVVRLVVDLSASLPPRLRDPEDQVEICRVRVPCLRACAGAPTADAIVALIVAADQRVA